MHAFDHGQLRCITK